MRPAVRIAGVLSIAACGTLAGHAATYLIEGHTMEDGRHGYFAPSVEIAVASALLLGIVAVVRRLTAPVERRASEAMPLPTVCLALATLQIGGFVAMELCEGNAPDLTGCGIEALTALLIGAVVSLFLGFVERYVPPISATYVGRRRNARPAIRRLPTDSVPPSLLLAVRVGICRFQRPPPIFG